jgi:hypothetical protein
MTDNRYGDTPLGKSVEEVEGEAGNRVNSSLPGEARRDLEADAAFVPAVVGGGHSTGAALVVSDPAVLVEGGSRPDEDRRDPAAGPVRSWADQDQVNTPMPDRDRDTSES